ncbi:MAG: efflux RND transporter periplasmic adaptor subunit [Deltaproteobacteria bacterium]|nr:efflux RND transporter periplasmic adaptor subunit [Deltaproteobacteria bacterium]
MKKRLFLLLLLVALLVAAVLLLKKRQQEIADTPVAVPMTHSVRTTRAETRTISQTSSFLAELQAAKSAAIASKFSGRIGRLAVHESQQVQPGDRLLQIDDQEIVAGIKGLQAQLVAATKQLDYNRTQYQRNRVLFQAGGLAHEKLESSEVASSAATAAVQDLQQKISGLQNQLEYLDIRAPFAGIVGTIFLHQGDLAVPGRPILMLNSLPQKLTFSFVPETAAIQLGQKVLRDGIKTGLISRLYNDAKNGLAVAEVTPEQRFDLPGGSYLSIEVVTKTATGCVLPIQALLHRAQGVSVMQYQNDHFTELPVSIQAQNAEFALLEPCPTQPVALAAEAKLSLLPGYGRVRIIPGLKDE